MRKHFDKIALGVMAFAVLVAIAFMNGSLLGLSTSIDADSEAHSDDSYFTDNDLNGSWDSSDATVITLEGDGASVSGSGAYTYDGNVVIGSSGTYVVSGSLTDGSLVVDANDNSKVWILFDGVTIDCADDACLVVDEADKVFLTLADGTTNTLTSGSTFSEEALEDNTDGAIFAHDDLTINGSGSLAITAGYGHGVSANDDLVVTGGTISVTAPKDGMHANDSLRITQATLSIASEDDGLAADNEGAYVYIESGTFNIACADEGIYAPGDVTIAGGDLVVAAGTESGHHGVKAGGTCTISDGSLLISACYEGVQANYIDVTGGDVTIYPTDDGFNASTGDSSTAMGMGGGMGSMGGSAMGGGPGGGQMPGSDSSSADGANQEGQTSDAQGGSGAAAQATPGSGTGSGANAGPGGGQAPSMGSGSDAGAMGGMATSSSEDLPWLHISGGTITIVNDSGNDADGLDSNGDIIISGGDIRVSLTNSGTNSAIDYASESGGVCEISGGTVVACGSYSMAEGFDSSSTQCSILYNISSGVDAGTTVALEDAAGNVLLSYEVPCSFSSVSLSCPEMQVGETYLVVVGDSAEEVTLTETAVSSGDVESTMFGGGFAQGGGMQDASSFGGSDGGQASGADQGGTEGQGGSQDATGTDVTQGEGAPSGQTPPTGGQAPGSGQMPGGSGQTPGAGGQMPGGQEADTSEAQDDATEEASSEKAYTTETLAICGISVVVLVAGLAFAIIYTRRRP